MGTGEMISDIRFPGAVIPLVHSDVKVYRADLGNGKGTFVAVAPITIPAPRLIVIAIAVERDHGRFGLRLVGSVPKIAGGAGSVTRLWLRFHRGVFSATCADRHLDVRFGAVFNDGATLGGAVERPCIPRG